jgi:hypothetical protein
MHRLTDWYTYAGRRPSRAIVHSRLCFFFLSLFIYIMHLCVCVCVFCAALFAMGFGSYLQKKYNNNAKNPGARLLVASVQGGPERLRREGRRPSKCKTGPGGREGKTAMVLAVGARPLVCGLSHMLSHPLPSPTIFAYSHSAPLSPLLPRFPSHHSSDRPAAREQGESEYFLVVSRREQRRGGHQPQPPEIPAAAFSPP